MANAAPVVKTNAAVTVGVQGAISASSFIGSVTDANGDPITRFGFWDNGVGGGHFELNGVALPPLRWIFVNANDLAGLKYVGGAGAGAETVYVTAFDGRLWSTPAPATVTTTAAPQPVNHAPVVTAAPISVVSGASVAASQLLASVKDSDGDAIRQYAFFDSGSGGGHFALNGVTQAPGVWITINAADLGKLTYVGGTVAGSETVSIKAFDGKAWSSVVSATATTTAPVNHAPVVTATNASVAQGQIIAASALIASVTDADRDVITRYGFYDTGSGGGYFTLNGVVQAGGRWIYVNAADLATLKYVGGGAAGSEGILIQAFDGKAWSASATATVTTLADAWGVITDTGIHADVVKLVGNGALTYAGMLQILQDAAAGGITSSEFSSLTTLDGLFNKSGGISVSEYLFDISNRLINGDAANATWTGGGATSVALGNLKAGTTQTQMSELIGKWFLGTDRPTADVAYKIDTDALYSSAGPSYLDVNQGALGDCYLLASIAEVALRDPNTIKSMFVDNGNGTYGVRFIMGGKAEYVTVDNALPYGSGYWANGSTLEYANGAVKWVGLIEKAYAQLNMDGTPNNSAGNAYSLIEGGWADPITEITGKSLTEFDTGSYASETQWETVKSSIVAAVTAGQEALVATGSSDIGNLVGDHMFEVTGYDLSTGKLVLHNPWGSAYSGSLQMTFEASMADLYADGAVVITASGRSWA